MNISFRRILFWTLIAGGIGCLVGGIFFTPLLAVGAGLLVGAGSLQLYGRNREDAGQPAAVPAPVVNQAPVPCREGDINVDVDIHYSPQMSFLPRDREIEPDSDSSRDDEELKDAEPMDADVIVHKPSYRLH